MYTVYDVQTFYGTRQKTFQNRWNAEQYLKFLAREYDADLLEFHRRKISQEDYILTDFAD